MKARALALFLRTLGHTWRIEWMGGEHLDAARRSSPSGNIIYAFWHEGLGILAFTHRERGVHALVSQSRDGEIIAGILDAFGYGLVRGSSRRGGVGALIGLARQLEAGHDVAIAVDGPIGPRYSVRSGAISVASRTRRPIVPIVVSADRWMALPTWDRLRLPWPGARVQVQQGAALWVENASDPAALLQQQGELETRLRACTTAAEARHGRTPDFRDVQDLRPWLERASEQSDPAWPLRLLAALHGTARAGERRLRPRPRGRGTRPWVVGIGNLEAGGTGKTPCVIALATALQERGARVVVLTRGHRGALGRRDPVRVPDANTGGAADETRLLAAALGTRVALVVSRDKRRGLAWLCRENGYDVVLVDDALQTAGLAVDRHLVLLDWQAPFGNGWLLPAGRLREPPSALLRADAVLFTRAESGPRSHAAWQHLWPSRCFTAREHVWISRPDGARIEAESLRETGVALLSGIGRPRAFEAAAATLAATTGTVVRRSVRVGDHQDLTPALTKLQQRLARLDCRWVVTTRKDLCRLPPTANKEPLLVLEQRLEVDRLEELLRVLLPAPAHSSAKSAKFTETEA